MCTRSSPDILGDLGIAEAVWVLSRNNMIGHWKVNAAFARTEKSGDL
jgi:hypothetical protein